MHSLIMICLLFCEISQQYAWHRVLSWGSIFDSVRAWLDSQYFDKAAPWWWLFAELVHYSCISGFEKVT